MTTMPELPIGTPLTEPGLRLLLGGLMPELLSRRGDLLAVQDAADGRYVCVNPAMAAFLRRPPTEVPGCSGAELFDAPLATALRAA